MTKVFRLTKAPPTEPRPLMAERRAPAEVVGVTHDEAAHEVHFTFRLISQDQNDGVEVRGIVPDTFDDGLDCLLAEWASVILGTTLPLGYELGLDVLVGRRCVIEVDERLTTEERPMSKRLVIEVDMLPESWQR